MVVRIIPRPDHRAQRMVANPSGYFRDAREKLRAEVIADMNWRRRRRR